MEPKRYVIMGAGEVGRYLARSLSVEGHRVTVIDANPAVQALVDEQLDATFVLGNGSHVPVLETAGVADCDLFIAASSSDEANLASSLLAKQIGAPRTVVRVATSEDITRYRRTYERAFAADLLLSTQLLTTTRVLNHVLGFNTLEIEYLAGGAVQVRRMRIGPESALAGSDLAHVDLPRGSLVLGLISEGVLRVPQGQDRAQPGDEAIVLGTSAVIDEVEKSISGRQERLGTVVIAGGGSTGRAVAAGLAGQARAIKLIERDRERAETLAAGAPGYEVFHGDATDPAFLAAEGVGQARAFIALTGNDETNLMACLLAQELGVRKLTALVQKSETSSLWRKVALLDVVSPRTIAAERIRAYIENDYEPHIVSFDHGAAQFTQRRVSQASPAAGGRLRDIEIPQGLIVAAVVRDGKAEVPGGEFELRVGDDVVLFVHASEASVAQLLFPDPEAD